MGGIKVSPTEFYKLTIHEAKLMIKGFEDQEQRSYYLNLYAQVNAIGTTFGGKDFKQINPFKEDEKENKEITQAQRDEILDLFKYDKR